jgi:hypothetical protein
VGDAGVDAIPAFREMLAKAVNRQKEKATEDLIAASL